MNANGVSKQYGKLTADERFRLILAASARGDEAEGDRLRSAGQRITLSMPDHSPYRHAFDVIALLMFIELLEEAAGYAEVLLHASESESFESPDDAEAEGAMTLGEPEADPDAQPAHYHTRRRSEWQRDHDIVLAAGFWLRTKYDGWKLFCQRKGIPSVTLWEGLPGFERVQHARALAERVAFAPEDMVRWRNMVRPEGKPKATLEGLMSPERLADSLQNSFQQLLGLWGA
jgi:hypothetical protein